MQPISGSQWTRVSGTAAGTTVVANAPTVLQKILLPSQKTGTVTIYDNASGTSATTLVAVIPNTNGTIPVSIDLGIQMRRGIVAETGGTTDFVVIWN